MRKIKYSFLGAAVGCVIGIWAYGCAFPAHDPAIWRTTAEATGLWPSSAVTPVLWRGLIALGAAPIAVAAVAAGLVAFAVFDILWRLLTLLVCPQDDYRNWWRLTIPAVALLGELLAAFSEPLGRLALSGSPAVLTLALLLLAVDLFLVSFFTEVIFDDNGRPVSSFRPNLGVYLALLLSGVLVVETPVALVLPVLFAVGYRVIFPFVLDGRYRDHPEDLRVYAPVPFSNWGAFFLWIAGGAPAVSVSCLTNGGFGLSRYLVEILRDIAGAASPLGWVVWTGCTLIPFALACGLLAVLTKERKELKFGLGVAALVVGLASLAAVSPATRGDWALVSSAVVRSPLMQALGAVFAAQAATLSLALFAYFAFHALPRDLALRPLVVAGVGLAFLGAAAVALAGLSRGTSRAVRQAIADALSETVAEAKGLSFIFTDGSADVGLELVARQKNSDLRARPLITGGPFAAQENASTLLRDWFAADSSNLQTSAVQVGFDLWKRARKPQLPASGLLARADWPEGARERGIRVAEELGDRMAALARAGALVREAEPAVREVFSAVLWRLSRLARQRGETARADALDQANDVVRELRERAQRERTAAFLKLTDSEGLQLALKRADFHEARHYAAAVLSRAPDDLAANFAMGMSLLTENDPKQAIVYFERAHKAKPTEPAILNNLAIAYLRTGDLVAAEAWAKKALERAPDIPEIQDTVREIKEAKRK